MTNLHTKFEDPCSKLLIGQGSGLQCNCDLDLQPRNIKINKGHLLVMINHHTKLKDPRAMNSLVIDLTRFPFYLVSPIEFLG